MHWQKLQSLCFEDIWERDYHSKGGSAAHHRCGPSHFQCLNSGWKCQWLSSIAWEMKMLCLPASEQFPWCGHWQSQ